MNKLLKYAVWGLLAGLTFGSCVKEIDPDPIVIQKPVDLGDAYYTRLREYKKSKHQLAFGWFGRWTAMGPSGQKFLSSAPDSMDIISIWGQYNNLTPAMIEDLRHVQQVKGTRVTFTVFSHNMTNLVGDALENTAENIPAAARMLADTVLKYGYDGIDFDHECSSADLLYDKNNMTTLLREMRQNIGPDKLILVDGHVDYITEEGWSYADYAVQQAYGTSSGSLWSKVSKYITPDRFILTENFEDYWSGGGQLLKQAAWNPAEGVKGGCGSYHMEYEYAHSDVPYKWIRQAIQIMNPSTNEAVWRKAAVTEDIIFTESGLHAAGGAAILLQAQVFRPVAGLRVGLEYDPTLVDAYNEEHGTTLEAVPEANLSYPERLGFEGDSYFSSEDGTVAVVNPGQLKGADGEEISYLAPFRLRADTGHKEVKVADDAVVYLRVNLKADEVKMTLSDKGIQNFDAAIPATNLNDPAECELEDIVLSMNYNAAEDLAIAFENDPDAAAAYNEANGTSYVLPAASHLKVSSPFVIRKGSKKSAPVSVRMVDLQRLADGEYLFALRPVIENPEIYGCDDSQILYLHISKSVVNVDNSLEAIEGDYLDRTGWTYALSSNVTTLASSAQLFDNSTTTGWYTYRNGRSTATVDMAAVHKLAGFRTGVRSSYKAQTLENIETSTDGENWTTQALKIKGGAVNASYQYFGFFAPVECRYIRMTYTGTYSGCSEFGAYEVQ